MAIVASVVAVVTLLMALFIGPSEPGTFGRYAPLVLAVEWPIALTMAGISMVACLVVTWEAYCLWKYEVGSNKALIRFKILMPELRQ